MIIVVDSNEQAPWTFEGLKVEVCRKKLATGDYSVCGLEDRVTIERKSLDDWVNTVIHDRSRFFRELDRMRGFDFRCVIIEATTREILKGQYTSKTHPNSVMELMHHVQVAQSVPVMLGGTRAECQLHAWGLLKAAEKRLRGSDKAAARP